MNGDKAVMAGVALFVAGLVGGIALGKASITEETRFEIMAEEEGRRLKALEDCLGYASTHPPRIGAEIRDACMAVWVAGKDRFDSDRGTTELPR